MRPRVKLTNAKLISIQSDTEEKVERVLYGTFADENENGKEGDALFTIKVLEINGQESKCFVLTDSHEAKDHFAEPR